MTKIYNTYIQNKKTDFDTTVKLKGNLHFNKIKHLRKIMRANSSDKHQWSLAKILCSQNVFEWTGSGKDILKLIVESFKSRQETEEQQCKLSSCTLSLSTVHKYPKHCP